MGFNGWKGFAIVGNPRIGDQVNEKPTVHKLFRQRLGGKQMPARSARSQNHHAAPNSTKHLTHQLTLMLSRAAMWLMTGRNAVACG